MSNTTGIKYLGINKIITEQVGTVAQYINM